MATVSKRMLKDVDMKGNILSVFAHVAQDYAALSNALLWYPDAYRLCENANEIAKLSVWQFVGIVAATSPRLQWARNITVALQVVNRLHNGQNASGIMVNTSNFAKCTRIFNGENPLDVLGTKTCNFYANIMGDYSRVTVDAHACNIALFGLHGGASGDIAPSPLTYDIIASAYKDAALIVNLEPAFLQSSTWIFKAKNEGRVE